MSEIGSLARHRRVVAIDQGDQLMLDELLEVLRAEKILRALRGSQHTFHDRRPEGELRIAGKGQIPGSQQIAGKRDCYWDSPCPPG